jgi:hypothetical protein
MNKINFIKKFFVFVLCFSFSLNSMAIELDEATRTVTLDASGNATILTPEQVKRGKRLFNAWDVNIYKSRNFKKPNRKRNDY